MFTVHRLVIDVVRVTRKPYHVSRGHHSTTTSLTAVACPRDSIKFTRYVHYRVVHNGEGLEHHTGTRRRSDTRHVVRLFAFVREICSVQARLDALYTHRTRRHQIPSSNPDAPNPMPMRTRYMPQSAERLAPPSVGDCMPQACLPHASQQLLKPGQLLKPVREADATARWGSTAWRPGAATGSAAAPPPASWPWRA